MTAIDPAAVTILLVDDEPENIEFYKRTLRAYQILAASSGEEGLVMLGQQPIDIVITDQRMPGITGAMLLERARAVNPLMRRMIVSAFANADHLLEAINRGQAERYLVKPISADVLRQEVETLAQEYVNLHSEHERVVQLEDQLTQLRLMERRRGDRRRGDRRAPQGREPSLTQQLDREVARCLRYRRNLSVLVVGGGDNDASPQDIAGKLREIDIVTRLTSGIVAVLPETDRHQASVAQARLLRFFPNLSIRVATLPEDGSDLSALLAVAR